MRRIILGLCWVLLAAQPATAAERVKVVASFSILGDVVQQVTGNLANVTTIVGPDADAHVYQPNTTDARAVANADVVFVNGLGFETWSKSLIANAGGNARVFVATEGITPLLVDGEIDPHAWNSLTNGMVYVQNVAAGMAMVDPANAAQYTATANAYIAQLRKVHNDALARFSTA